MKRNVFSFAVDVDDYSHEGEEQDFSIETAVTNNNFDDIHIFFYMCKNIVVTCVSFYVIRLLLSHIIITNY